MKQFLTHIVYSNIVVALSTGALSAGVAYSIQLENWWSYGLFSTLATFAVYNGQRLFKAKEAKQTPWITWVGDNARLLTVVVVISAIAAAVVFFTYIPITYLTVLLVGFSSLISSFYVVRFKGRNMREIPHLKIHLISLSWTIILVVLPMLQNGWNINVLIVGVAHYLYVLAVTIPFDIRDIKYDSEGQHTIPQMIGVKNARILALMILVCFGAIMFAVRPSLIANPLFYVAVFAQMALVLGAGDNPSDLYCAGGIDGAISLLGISYFLG